MEWRHPSIIALKGFPFTGKSTLASQLRGFLYFCQVLSLDDILGSITPGAYSPEPESDEQLVGQAFDILCGLVEEQMSIGQSVIIDSLPLSRSHLDRLVRLSESSNATKLIVVDCRISREHAWKMRFEERYHPEDSTCSSEWYKARDCERDVERLLISGYDERLDEPIPGVSRLTLIRDDESNRGCVIILAIQALVFCQDDRHVDYRAWSAYHRSINMRTRNRSCPQRRCRDRRDSGHNITIFLEQQGAGDQNEPADCAVCETPVLGPAYACDSCHLVLHKSCAELQTAEKRSFTPRDFPVFLWTTSGDDDRNECFFNYPKNLPCLPCREDGLEFSDQCPCCIYESHFKSGLVPTVIRHPGHDHMLTFWASHDWDDVGYTCGACQKVGRMAAYVCASGCNNRSWYHVTCALLPQLVPSHTHGGYDHPLRLTVKRDDTDQDDFPCDHCLENMRPEDWFYYCAECPQTYHLLCAFAHHDA